MPGPEIQIPWSSVARPIIGGDEPDEYIYIGWLTSMPIDARSASPLAPFSALLRLSIVDG